MWDHPDRVRWPTDRTKTETILVWHIATTLFHHTKRPSQENNDALKERWVALDLSNYCFRLLKRFPELLPEEVEWTEKMYESLREEIYGIDRSSGQKSTAAVDRCDYAMKDNVIWDENSLVGKGAMLAKLLVFYADNGRQVWAMLTEFWAEMLLFIAPSDNVEGHKEVLEKGELITQVWALLTHAGILTRPKSTEHLNHENESNEVTEDLIV
ncbi:hypothetical protein LUZ62_039839 [Rhynchospora pubera]|uniref:DUF4220 domain-containing protein n=1 Tax=Rhynchospora pubera TaxID=906938 RepID=A0AAV8F5H1_9POAL|nr:hypothetical protein LUZ62_039839 [Rhynchospora pubera]